MQPSTLLVALGLTCALGLAHAPRACAQASLVLTVEPEVPVDAAALRDGLARDLGREVQLEGPGATRLSVAMREGQAEVAYSDPASTRSRRVELPADVGEATATLTLIASNLVRDPTEQLVAPPVVHRTSALGEPAEGPDRIAVEAAASRDTGPPSIERPDAPVENLAVREPFELAAGILGGAASTLTGVQGYWYVSVDLLGTVHPNIRIGLSRVSIGLGASSIEGFLFSLQGTPTFELFAFVDPQVEVFAQVGVALQGRGQTALNEGIFQLAPFLGAGARFWLTDWLTIGVELGLHVVATDSFLMGDVALPQGSVAGSLGLTTGFHF